MSASRASPEGLLVQRLVEELEGPAFNRWLSPVAVGIDQERMALEIRLPYRAEFSYGPSGAVHGGVICSLIDVAGYAAAAIWQDGPAPTVSLQTEFLAPALGDLHARAAIRKRGRLMTRVDVEVSAAGRLVALGRGTFATGAAS